PKNQADLDSFKAVDMRFSVPIKLHERITLEPSVQLFNVFNFANFDTSGNLLSGVLAPAAIAATGTPGSVNGTPNTITDRTNRVDRKSTRLNSSHLGISYAVFCLKKKKY